MQSKIEDMQSGTTNQVELSKKEVLDLDVPLPPLNEQRRIVAKLDACFAHTRKAEGALDRVPALLDKLKKSVLAKAFRGDLTAQWRADNPDVEPASQLLERIRAERKTRTIAAAAEKARARAQAKAEKAGKPWTDADDEKALEKGRANAEKKYKAPAPVDTAGLPELPKGWVWASVDELSALQKHSLAIGPFGSSLKVPDYREEGVPLVFVREIRADSFGDQKTKFVSREKAKALAAHFVEGGDLLITKMGDPPGDTAIYPEYRPNAVITADCIKLKPHSELTSAEFLKFALRSGATRDAILAETKGVAQQKLSLKRFRDVPVPIPPFAEQKQIAGTVALQFRKAARLHEAVASEHLRIGKLTQSLLAKAFRGELVPQDPTDEPASVLLERIRAERATAEAEKKGRKKAGQGKRANAPSLFDAAQVAEAKAPLVQAFAAGRTLKSSEARALTGLDAAAVRKVLAGLVDAGVCVKTGKGRGVTYGPPAHHP